jgi:type IV pilus assembly protein PilV
MLMKTTVALRVSSAAGFTMLEVLITIVIVALGLLGVAGLQARMQVAEVESYQRAQAIVLLDDVVARINANRKNSMSYVTSTALGTDTGATDCTGLTGAALDLCAWNNALLGATETSGGESRGAMIGARGCITNTVATMPREFVVAVAWQGLAPTVTPTISTCGQGSYGNDATRRVLVARIKIGCLQNDPTTGACVTP